MQVSAYLSRPKTITAYIVAAFLTLYSASSIYAADFRKASWGMTMDDVQALHAGEIPADRRLRAIAYDGKLAGLDVLIFYQFDERGGLFKAGYEIYADYEERTGFVSDYEKINSLLRRKYPEAQAPQQSWTNRLFENQPNKWSRAVRLGHLSFAWSHTVERTRIEHLLAGNRRQIDHVINYVALTDLGEQDVLEQL